MAPVHLLGSYYYREVSPEEFAPFYAAHRERMFEGALSIPVDDYMTCGEMQRRKEYDAAVTALYELHIFIMYNDEVIGWHIGRQGARDAGHMSNTAIFPDHRNKGVYAALLPHVLEIFRTQGFAKVVSRHHVSNNSVLVPKLKAGFVITGFEIDERYGLFAVLSYIFNEKRRDVYRFWTGHIKAGEEIRKYL